MLSNSRFYILTGSILLSALVIAWLRLSISSDALFFIRTSQVFGLLCLVYWYTTLIISPIGHIIGKQRMRYPEFARRAIGVSAFLFALLHAAFSFFGNLGGFGAIGTLPDAFKWSLIGGLVALVFLALMAATSFDKVVRFMTYRKWKWLQRLGYVAGVLVILHVWSIGSHLAYSGYQIAAFIALIALFGLELFRVTKALSQKFLHLDKTEFGAMFLASWAIVGVLIFMLPVVISNYHTPHAAEVCETHEAPEGSHVMYDGSTMGDGHVMTEIEENESCEE